MLKTIIIASVWILLSQNGFGQDENHIFKLLLFEDCKLVSKGILKAKNGDFLNAFEKKFSFKVQKVNSIGFPAYYKFYGVTNDGITIKDTAYLDSEPVLLQLNCNKYIFLINELSGEYYRLSGFDKNDFLHLFRDMKQRQLESTSNISVFAKNYQVEGLDFRCLYRFCKSDSYNEIKFPCSKKCQDNISTH